MENLDINAFTMDAAAKAGRKPGNN